VRIELTDVNMTFAAPAGAVQALAGLSLSVDKGEFVLVHGPSGCGKTTLLLVLGTLLRPTSGTVQIEGESPYGMSPEPRCLFRARHIGFVFQQFHLVPYLNVLDNILVPALALPDVNARERARELLSRFGLTERAEHLPAMLSTGERQRTALARALLNQPGILLADEPTGNLDAQNAEIVMTRLGEFVQHGGTVIAATHDERAARYATRRLSMAKGRLLGEPK